MSLIKALKEAGYATETNLKILNVDLIELYKT